MSGYIGCDYNSKEVSIGCIKDDKVVAAGSVKITDQLWHSFHMLQNYLSNLQGYYGADTIWIERPWMRSIAGRRADTGLFTMRTATIIELAALEIGMQPEFVYPQTWRKAVYGSMPRGTDTKEKAVEYVTKELGYELPVMGKTGRGSKPDHNIAEAICLAVYGKLM